VAGLLTKKIKPMNKDILEGNKLIAESPFAPDEHKYWMAKLLASEGDRTRFFNAAKYHSSWDWLMPVVEKIEKDVSKEPFFGFTVVLAGHFCHIKCHEKNCQDGIIYQTPYGTKPKTKIEAIIWLAVVEFIKWYNQNSKHE
jgi:hypothetical protein